ncbi:Uu.00g090860.m01.CDS01 [Anthostomella pinea]|uniref:Uu.00g090860.m01.CDS01 n=1 Tax=Anthostomella pinea TaxID=933095 RepID=A0AAI8VP59_9PEZI|nr:Uu.00g090860.m01.CDS01 [Anthostomella pinea]
MTKTGIILGADIAGFLIAQYLFRRTAAAVLGHECRDRATTQRRRGDDEGDALPQARQDDRIAVQRRHVVEGALRFLPLILPLLVLLPSTTAEKAMSTPLQGGKIEPHAFDDAKVQLALSIGRDCGTGQVGDMKPFSFLIWWFKSRHLGTDPGAAYAAGVDSKNRPWPA